MGAAIKIQNIFGKASIVDRIMMFVDDRSIVVHCDATDVANIADLADFGVDDLTELSNGRMQRYLYSGSHDDHHAIVFRPVAMGSNGYV